MLWYFSRDAQYIVFPLENFPAAVLFHCQKLLTGRAPWGHAPPEYKKKEKQNKTLKP